MRGRARTLKRWLVTSPQLAETGTTNLKGTLGSPIRKSRSERVASIQEADQLMKRV